MSDYPDPVVYDGREIFTEIVECPCQSCECPELTDEEGPCLACRTGHHEGEEG